MEVLAAAAARVESERAMEREVVAARQAVAVAAVVARAARERARVVVAAAAAAEAPRLDGAAGAGVLGDKIATCLAHWLVEETNHPRDMRIV
mgnify:CR=1 FL=1